MKSHPHNPSYPNASLLPPHLEESQSHIPKNHSHLQPPSPSCSPSSRLSPRPSPISHSPSGTHTTHTESYSPPLLVSAHSNSGSRSPSGRTTSSACSYPRSHTSSPGSARRPKERERQRQRSSVYDHEQVLEGFAKLLHKQQVNSLSSRQHSRENSQESGLTY